MMPSLRNCSNTVLLVLSLLFFTSLAYPANAATTNLTSNNITAPVNNYMLNFSWANSTTFGYRFNNITFTLPTNLTAISGYNATNSTNVTSFAINGQTVSFGNATGSWTSETNLWFTFNISANSSGNYTITGTEGYVNVTGGTANASNISTVSSSVTLNISKGTIALTNATFSNYTYNGSSLIMSFTATPSAPTGGGIISDILNFTLWSNNTLVNSTVGQFGNPPITISNTSAAAGLYVFTFNISNATDNNYTLPASLYATLNISKGTPDVKSFVNDLASNQTITYPNTANIRGNSTTSSGIGDVNFNLYVLNATSGASVFSNTTTSLTDLRLSSILAGNGTYQIVFNTSGGANWTSATNNTIFELVNKGTPDVKAFINETVVNNTITYPTSTTLKGNSTTTSGIADVTFSLYALNSATGVAGYSNTSQSSPAFLSSSLLGNGTWQVVLNTTGGANWTSASNSTLYVIVNKGAPSLSITISPSTSVAPGTLTTATGSGNPTSGSSDLSYAFTRAFGATTLAVSNPETQAFDPGTSYTYTYSTGGGANWTSASVTATLRIGAGAVSGGGAIVQTAQPQTTISVGKVDVFVQTIASGSTAVIAVSNSDTKVNEIDVNSKNQLSQVSITVNNIAQLPSGIATPQGNIFNQWNVVKNNIADTDINQVIIKFNVDKSWLTVNNVDSTTVALQRFSNNTWQSLTTSKTSEDSNFVYYSATSPGLSYFAITGQPLTAPVQPPARPPAQPPTEPPVSPALPKPTAPQPKPYGQTFVWIIVVLVIAVAVLVIRKGKPSKKKERE